MIDSQTPLVLGSSSPRRQRILRGLGIPTRVVPAAIGEARRGAEGPEEYVRRVVGAKLAAVGQRLDAGGIAAVLVADTIVVLDGDVLGKPADIGAAASLLRRLRGRTHDVMTRYAIADTRLRVVAARTVRSEVTLRAAEDAEIERYAATGEGLDKAGAYAAQGVGSFLVASIRGSYTNVVGLPACEVVLDLRAGGLLGPYP